MDFNFTVCNLIEQTGFKDRLLKYLQLVQTLSLSDLYLLRHLSMKHISISLKNSKQKL